MREVIKQIVVDLGSADDLTFKVRGYTDTPIHQDDSDAMITKATGLESASLAVTGGPASYGGSAYTGLKTNDREVILTVRPNRLGVNEIKQKLNSLVGRSLTNPLRFRMLTSFDDGEESMLWAECYITGVSAPIFEADDKLQVTLKMPSAYFEREYEELGTKSDTELVRTHNDSTGFTRIDYDIVREDAVSDYRLSAPSPVYISFMIESNIKRYIQNIYVTDKNANQLTINTSHLFSSSTDGGDDTMEVYISTRERTVMVKKDYGTYVPSNEITVSVRPNWPVVYPGLSDVSFAFDLGEGHPINPQLSIRMRAYGVYRRVFGV